MPAAIEAIMNEEGCPYPAQPSPSIAGHDLPDILHSAILPLALGGLAGQLPPSQAIVSQQANRHGFEQRRSSTALSRRLACLTVGLDQSALQLPSPSLMVAASLPCQEINPLANLAFVNGTYPFGKL
jgi:hypothetical protein